MLMTPKMGCSPMHPHHHAHGCTVDRAAAYFLFLRVPDRVACVSTPTSHVDVCVVVPFDAGGRIWYPDPQGLTGATSVER